MVIFIKERVVEVAVVSESMHPHLVQLLFHLYRFRLLLYRLPLHTAFSLPFHAWKYVLP